MRRQVLALTYPPKLQKRQNDSIYYTTGPDPIEGKYYALVEGTIKNISRTELPVYDFFAGVFDVNGYEFKIGATDSIITDERGQMMSKIDPLISYGLRLYVSVPAELVNTTDNSSLKIGFFDGFDNHELARIRNDEDVFEKCPYSYIYDLSNASASPEQSDNTENDGNESSSGDAETAATASSDASTGVLPLLAVGETVSGDDYDFTLNGIEFTYELLPEDTSSMYTSYTPANGKTYIHIDGTFYNKAKRDYCVRDLPLPEADYDNGYTYSGFAIANDPQRKSSFIWVSSYVACTPLESAHYHGLIECPKIVDESDAPLFVTITMPDGMTYRSNVRE